MPRRARLALADTPWHIIQRGNNRAVCFFSEDNYRFYLDHLDELSRRFACAVHAYVLMTNHVHLLLTPRHADVPGLMMKHLGQRYVQYVNRRYRRSGTLWEGRFRSCPTQSEDYVLACYRYIELNPVRAGMVEHPRQYRWSSYRANGEVRSDPLVTAHPEFLRVIGSDPPDRAAYRELFKVHLDPERIDEIRQATNGNFALGGKRFHAEIEAAIGRRVTRGKSGRPGRQGVVGDEQLTLL